MLPDCVEADGEGYLFVTERGVTALLIEALRDLRAEKDAQIAAQRAAWVYDLAAARDHYTAEIESLQRDKQALANRRSAVEQALARWNTRD